MASGGSSGSRRLFQKLLKHGQRKKYGEHSRQGDVQIMALSALVGIHGPGCERPGRPEKQWPVFEKETESIEVSRPIWLIFQHIHARIGISVGGRANSAIKPGCDHGGRDGERSKQVQEGSPDFQLQPAAREEGMHSQIAKGSTQPRVSVTVAMPNSAAWRRLGVSI